MGGYVRQFDVTVTMDGEPITVTLRQAKFGDVARVSPDMTPNETVKVFQDILRGYIVEMKGPLDRAGTQVPKDEFLDMAYFAPAVIQIGQEWVERATPSDPCEPVA